MSMTDEQKQAALAVFGETLGTSLVAGAESKSKELETNIAHKGELEEQAVKPEEITIEAIVSQMNVGLEPINEALAKMAEVIQEQQAKLESLEKQEAIKAETEMPKFLFQAMRASDANKTTVAEGDELLIRKPQETNQEASVASSFFGGK